MPHFFVSPKAIRKNRFTISGSEAKHIATILRKKPGDEIAIFDGENQSFTGKLETVTPAEITGHILAALHAPEMRTRLRLIQGLPKSSKMDWIIEKGTELGFFEFFPVKTERSQVSLAHLSSKVERWERLAQAAAKQSGRSSIPKVHAPLSWEACLGRLPENLFGLIPWESETSMSLRSLGTQRQPTQRDIYLLIGPEGGFTVEEVAQARTRGFQSITLGPRILRTETAALVAGALILYECGELE